MTKLEEIARAICASEADEDQRGEWDAAASGAYDEESTAEVKARYLTQAKAVLESLRTPSEGMLEAISVSVDVYVDYYTEYTEHLDADAKREVWQGLIDHIFSEGA